MATVSGFSNTFPWCPPEGRRGRIRVAFLSRRADNPGMNRPAASTKHTEKYPEFGVICLQGNCFGE
jgi:hypothetical protein